MLLLLFSIIFETENNYFDVACFAVHHCVALFCFQKQQQQHLIIIEQGVSNQKYVFVFTEDKTCKTGLFSIQRLKFTFTSSFTDRAHFRESSCSAEPVIGTWKKTSQVASSDAPELLLVFLC